MCVFSKSITVHWVQTWDPPTKHGEIINPKFANTNILVGGFFPHLKNIRQNGNPPQFSGWTAKMFELPPSSIGDSSSFTPLHCPRIPQMEMGTINSGEINRECITKSRWIMCTIKKISYIWSNHQAELKINTDIFYLISQVIKVYLCVTFYSTKIVAIKSPFFPTSRCFL